jgi:hypothetical protein
VSGQDIAAVITAAGGAIAAVIGAYNLLRKNIRELAAKADADCEECYKGRRALLRWVNKLLDLLAQHGIPEPEGIDDELGLRRRSAVTSGDDESAA